MCKSSDFWKLYRSFKKIIRSLKISTKHNLSLHITYTVCFQNARLHCYVNTFSASMFFTSASSELCAAVISGLLLERTREESSMLPMLVAVARPIVLYLLSCTSAPEAKKINQSNHSPEIHWNTINNKYSAFSAICSSLTIIQDDPTTQVSSWQL